jgi:hypothetical protein
MKKIAAYLLILSFIIACGVVPAPTPAVENAAPAAETVQFTAVPTFTAEVQLAPDLPTTTPPSSGQVQGNQIRFAANGTFADVTDSIASGESRTYSVNAMTGQIMSISTFPQIPDGDWGYISLQIKGADGKILCPQAPDTACMYWRGVLPSTQDYLITLTPDGNVPQFILRVAVNPPGKQAQYFQYHNPATGLSLTYPDTFAPATSVYANYKIAPELSLQLIDSKTYEKTNLGEAYFFLSSSSDPQVVATCTQPNQNAGGAEEVVGNEAINGFTFVHSTSADAGAGNIYQQEIYRMVNQNICYEVIFFMHSSNVGNYTPGTVNEFDHDGLVQKMSSVLATFVIK